MSNYKYWITYEDDRSYNSEDEDNNYFGDSFERSEISIIQQTLGFNIQECPDENVLQAINQLPHMECIKLLPNFKRTQEMCDLSFKLMPQTIKYFPKSKITEEMCLGAATLTDVEQQGDTIRSILPAVFEAREGIIEEMIKVNPRTIGFIFHLPTEKHLEMVRFAFSLCPGREDIDDIVGTIMRYSRKWQTEEICAEACALSGLAIEFVSYNIRCERLSIIACAQNPDSIFKINHLTVSIVHTACKTRPELLKILPTKVLPIKIRNQVAALLRK